MNYEKLVQGILNIGEAMLQCGAEIFRVEDSLYRMYKSYGFVKYDVYVIPSNIQVTVESPEGEILTQIRHIESTGADYDRLNYLMPCHGMSVHIIRMTKNWSGAIKK